MKQIKKILLVLSIMLMGGLNSVVIAQDLVMTEVALDSSDLTARISPRNDLNGDLCALLKIQTPVPIEIEGNVIGDVVSMGNQTWAYIKKDTKRLKLTPEGGKTLDMIFDDWGVKSVNSGDCFKIEIEDLENLDEKVLLVKGTVLYDRKLYPQALSVFQRLQRIAKTDDILKTSYIIPAMHYLEAGDFKKAMSVYESMPQCPMKDWCIGALYLQANDVDKGMKYIERAEEAGDVEALTLLFGIYAGDRYHDYSDKGKAVGYATKLAGKGNADAQQYVGFCYINGLGVKKDIPIAIEFLTMAANQGKAEAQTMLGLIYNSEGYQDLNKARHWLNLAASQNNETAITLLKELGE